ncbi:unnamed protein product [Effrenium voratum]|nr:unnamed protein product [Effrenium voratum]
MLQNLFPIDVDQQFDLKITMAVHHPQSTLRYYCSAAPLATAPLSEAGDTDIQRIPPDQLAQLQEEALKRHRMGDMLPRAPGPEHPAEQGPPQVNSYTEPDTSRGPPQVNSYTEPDKSRGAQNSKDPGPPQVNSYTEPDKSRGAQNSKDPGPPQVNSYTEPDKSRGAQNSKDPGPPQVNSYTEPDTSRGARNCKDPGPPDRALDAGPSPGSWKEHAAYAGCLRGGSYAECGRVRLSWPRRRTQLTASQANKRLPPSPEEEELEQLRSLDKGVPELRRLHGEAMEAQRSGSVDAIQDLQAQLQEAVEARDEILRAARPYEPVPCPETRKHVLLRQVPNGDSESRARARFPAGKRRVLIMGLYHSCTNALAKELERRFDVEILNDWHTNKAHPDWKHRANRRSPPGLAEDVFCILLVKEPHFWLQSCSRELRNFFEIRPLGQHRRELPAQELWQLLGQIEHDSLIYENAMDLWNDTVRSYMDDEVYPSDQAVILRSEDFLFSFHEVMTTLGKLGALKEKSGCLEPLEERAKGHKECRTRAEALQFYRHPENQKAAFTSDQLALVSFVLDQKASKCSDAVTGNASKLVLMWPYVSWTTVAQMLSLHMFHLFFALGAVAIAKRLERAVPYDDGRVRLRSFDEDELQRLQDGEELEMVKVKSSFLEEDVGEVVLPSAWRDRLQVVRRIGSGSFGEVYQCNVTCSPYGGDVSMKLVKDPLPRDRREAEILQLMFGVTDYVISSTGSPDTVKDESGLWTVMPFMNSGELHDFEVTCRSSVLCADQNHQLLQWEKLGKPYSQVYIWALMFQVMQGVQALHNHGITHMDLKPQNIMINCNGPKCFATVIDLGLACYRNTLHRYQKCSWGGTPGFIAPEVWSRTMIGAGANDVFSLGVILYRLTYFKMPPFRGDRSGRLTGTYSPEKDPLLQGGIGQLIAAMLKQDAVVSRIRLDPALEALDRLIRAETQDLEILEMISQSPAERGVQAPLADCLFDDASFSGIDIGDESFSRKYCVNRPVEANGWLSCGICIGCNPCCKCQVLRHGRLVKHHFHMSQCQ